MVTKGFNINDYVLVKLTDVGRKIHLEYSGSFHLERYGIEYTAPEVDGYGYSKFQLWELMHIFGNNCYNGCDLPFETTILIPGESLT